MRRDVIKTILSITPFSFINLQESLSICWTKKSIKDMETYKMKEELDVFSWCVKLISHLSSWSELLNKYYLL